MAERSGLGAIAAAFAVSLVCGTAVAETTPPLNDATHVEQTRTPPRDVISPRARDAARRVMENLPGAPTMHDRKASEDLSASVFDTRLKLALMTLKDRQIDGSDAAADALREHATLLRTQVRAVMSATQLGSGRGQTVGEVQRVVDELAAELDAIAAEPPGARGPRADALLARLRLDGGPEPDSTAPAPTLQLFDADGDAR